MHQDQTLRQNQQTRAIVSISELNRALQAVRMSTSGTTRGFMLAFINNAGFGFNFFVRSGDFSASLHVVLTDQQSAVPEHSLRYQKGSPDDMFVQAYLDTSATNMRVDYARFISHLAARKSDWRFEPWEYGEPGRSQDNDMIWRTTLWPTARCIADHPPQCMDFIPRGDRTIVLNQLRGHATEGMIVLDK